MTHEPRLEEIQAAIEAENIWLARLYPVFLKTWARILAKQIAREQAHDCAIASKLAPTPRQSRHSTRSKAPAQNRGKCRNHSFARIRQIPLFASLLMVEVKLLEDLGVADPRVAYFTAHLAGPSSLNYGVYVDGVLTGIISLERISKILSRMRVGAETDLISHRALVKVLLRFIDSLFTDGCEVVEAAVPPINRLAPKLLKKCGMKERGVEAGDRIFEITKLERKKARSFWQRLKRRLVQH